MQGYDFNNCFIFAATSHESRHLIENNSCHVDANEDNFHVDTNENNCHVAACQTKWRHAQSLTIIQYEESFSTMGGTLCSTCRTC